MNRDQLDRIPDRLLLKRSTPELIDWLRARGWQMSLLDLDDERRRRGIRKAH